MEDSNFNGIAVPEKFTIGIDEHNVGFPSMKSKDGRWSNISVFEKHCGYKPGVQRDARKEVGKALKQAVLEVSNTPTPGFKLLRACNKAYQTKLYRGTECMVLRDPRGWDVQVTSKNFYEILKSNGMNLMGGEIAGVELLYTWASCADSLFELP